MFDDYNRSAAGGTSPTAITSWSELSMNGIEREGGLGVVATAAILTAAAAIIAALAPFVSSFTQPKSSADTSTPPVIDPSSGLPSAIDPLTGLPYKIDPATGLPVTPKNSTNYGLIAAGILAVGAGIYFLLPDDKHKKLIHHA